MLSIDGEARSELGRSISLQPHQTESSYELGQIALDSGDELTAKSDYLRVLAAASNHGGALIGMGSIGVSRKGRLGRQAAFQQVSALAQELTQQQNSSRHGFTLRDIQSFSRVPLRINPDARISLPAVHRQHKSWHRECSFKLAFTSG
jgi:hypothetical protein